MAAAAAPVWQCPEITAVQDTTSLRGIRSKSFNALSMRPHLEYASRRELATKRLEWKPDLRRPECREAVKLRFCWAAEKLRQRTEAAESKKRFFECERGEGERNGEIESDEYIGFLWGSGCLLSGDESQQHGCLF